MNKCCLSPQKELHYVLKFKVIFRVSLKNLKNGFIQLSIDLFLKRKWSFKQHMMAHVTGRSS